MDKLPICGNPECCVSTGIHDGLTFGSGKLDYNGFWENPCSVCARGYEKISPKDIPCWPFELKGNEMNSPVKSVQSNAESICPKQDLDESIRSSEQFNMGTKSSAD